MSSSYTATDAQAYEQLMGRWSGRLAEQLIGFARIEPGTVCSISGAEQGAWHSLLQHTMSPRRSSASTSPRPYIAYAATRSADPRLTFLVGDAVALDLPTGSFDRCFSLLALNFMSDPALRAIGGMRRVTRPGGIDCRRRVGLCGWPDLSADFLGHRRSARSRGRPGAKPTFLKPADRAGRARRCFRQAAG